MRMRLLTSSALVALPLLSHSASAILVAPNSQCKNKCGNVLQSTSKDDIACGDYIYDQQPGATVKSCLECELQSKYVAPRGISDMQALLYNIRYTANYCIFNDTKVGESPCITEFACGHFKNALRWDGLKVPSVGTGYEYCDGWDDANLFRCQNCLGQIGGQHTLFNYMTALSIACQQKPAPNKTILFDGNLFDGDPIKAGDISASNAAIASTFHPPTGLSLAAKIGITVAGLVVLLVATGCFIVCRGRRRRRKVLRDHAEGKYNYQDMGIAQEQMMEQWKAARDAGNFDQEKGKGMQDSPQSMNSAAFMTKPGNSWGGGSVMSNSPQTPMATSTAQLHGPYRNQHTSPRGSQTQLTAVAPAQGQVFSPYISQTVSPVSPMGEHMPNISRNGTPATRNANRPQWQSVPIPKSYRRGSVGTMSGRVDGEEGIEMSAMASRGSARPTPVSTPVSTSRDIERGPMDTVNDFGRSPVARSVTGSMRSGRSGRSFRERVAEDEQWRNHPGMAGFVPAPAPVLSPMSNHPPVSMRNPHSPSLFVGYGHGHQRSVSVESIGGAL